MGARDDAARCDLLVVVVILPSLMLMSETRAYPFLRIGGAVFGGAASVRWILERILNVETPST
jgi:hypothetical protein